MLQGHSFSYGHLFKPYFFISKSNSMRKLFLFLAFLFLIIFPFCCSFAQGSQVLVTVPKDATGGTAQGWLHLPSDYNTGKINYPVVFFYHGIGEAGTNPNTLLNQGVPQLIAQGMSFDNTTNPVDGKKYSFIILSLQDASWSPDPKWLPYEIAWLRKNYRIDTTRIYVTGLSAGGECSFYSTCDNDAVSSNVAACVSMSAASIWQGTPDFSLINKYQIKTWFICGTQDNIVGTAPTTNYNNDCNSVYPNSSKVTWFVGSHCCWNTYYDVNYKDAVSGLSVWQWLLTNTLKKSLQTLPVRFIHIDIKIKQ